MLKTRYVVLLAIVLVAWVYILWLIQPQPKYVYAVREEITHYDTSISWQLWCWREYKGGHIKKQYIGYFKMEGSLDNPERIETNLCEAK